MDSADQDGRFWQRVKEAFGDAFERDADDRERFLEQLGRDDPVLRAEVDSLLGSLGDAGVERGFGPPERGPGLGPGTPPEQVGRYRILSRLGAGGMGEVLLAHDPILDREVALKILPRDFSRDGGGRRRFLREARAAAGLNHPHITTIHEVGEVEGRCYIALEFVRGRSLREHLAGRSVDASELIELALPLAEALAFAHARGVVHRDVKATNVMVTERGTPKLLDFGLAQSLSVDGLPIGGRVPGTPGAMSPEQALGRQVDALGDVFSFGSLLYEMAAGRVAFAGATVREILEQVVHGEPPGLATLRPDLPAALVDLVRRCLRKDPRERPDDMDCVVAALRAVRATPGDVDGAGRPAPVERGLGRRRSAALAVVTLLALALLWWVGRDRPAPLASPAGGPAWATIAAFENLDDPDDGEQLGAMLGRLLAAHLAAADDGLSLLGAARLADAASSLGLPEGPIPVARAAEVARAAGASVMLVGVVRHEGDGLLARVVATDLTSGERLGVSEARGARLADVFEMAGTLGHQMRLVLSAPALTADERGALELQYTSSVDAYRAFVRGLAALERNHSDDAVAAFREAVTIDPAFALAQFRLAMALVWTGDFADIRPAVERALAFRERLPADVRLVLDAVPPYFYTDETREALPSLEAALAVDPDNRDALYMLGEILTHSSTRNDAARAERMFARMLDLDPGYSLVYDHVLSATLSLGRVGEAKELLADWEADGADELDDLSGLFALWEGRLHDAAGLLRDPLPAQVLLGDRETLAALTLRAVDELVAGLTDVSGVDRVVALGLRADVLLLGGRPEDAARLRELAASSPGTRSRDGFHTSMRSCERLRLAEWLALRGDEDEAARQVAHVLADQPDTPRFLFLAGASSARRGDASAARARVDALDEIVQAGWTPTADLYRDALRAEVALAEGRAADARSALSALVASGRLMEDWYAFDSSIGPVLREALARACLAMGDASGAAASLDGLFAAGLERLRHPLLELRAHLVRAQLAWDAGDARLARIHLEPTLVALDGTRTRLADEARSLRDELDRR